MSIQHTIAFAIAERNSIRQFTDCYRDRTIGSMDKNAFRVEKLKRLVAEDGGPAEFARKRSRNDADKPIDATYISQVLNGHRSFGERAAENMIRRADLPVDYFAIPTQGGVDFTMQTKNGDVICGEVKTVSATTPGDDRLSIRRALFKLSAGVSGYEIEYENGESEPIFMGKRWFDSHHFRPDKLLAIKVNGRSMEPSLHDGDLVIVNTEDVALKDGEVFAANYDGELVIKRLKRDAGQWYLASDNPDKVRFGDKLCSDGCGLIGRIVYKQSEHI